MSEPAREDITIRVLFFATLKDRIGVKETIVSVPEGSRVSDLKRRLSEEFTEAALVLATCLVSINHEYTGDDQILNTNSEVAFFPPVSGGNSKENGYFPTIFAITDQVLDLNQLLAQITLPTTGAACVFTGMVRAKTVRGKEFDTAFLEYEAYVPMAEAKMKQVAGEIRKQWPSVEGIAIVQRVGHLEPGTPTVLIACTAGHRDTGVFEAARYGIDRLKEIVPIWKKEVGPEGEMWVEGKYIPKPGE